MAPESAIFLQRIFPDHVIHFDWFESPVSGLHLDASMFQVDVFSFRLDFDASRRFLNCTAIRFEMQCWLARFERSVALE